MVFKTPKFFKSGHSFSIKTPQENLVVHPPKSTLQKTAFSFRLKQKQKNGVGEKLGKAWLPPRNDSLEGIPDIAHVSTVNIVWSLRNFFLWFTALFFGNKS